VKGGNLAGDLNAQRFGKISVSGGDFTGGLASSGAGAAGDPPFLESMTIKGGDFTGEIQALRTVEKIAVQIAKGVGGNMIDATVAIGKLAQLAVQKNVTNSLILVGASLGTDGLLGGGDDQFASGSIGKVNIGGAVAGSTIAAGLNPGDGILKNGNDTIVDAASKIASLIIKGAADPASYFASGDFGPVKIDGDTVNAGSDPRFLVG